MSTPDKTLFEGRFVLDRVLGRGGTCAVYKAWDERLERYVAIKRLEPPLSDDPRTRARFHREGKALARLSHPGLVTLIDRGATDTEEYLVFEYVEGESLKDLVRRRGHLPPEEACPLAGQVAEALAHAHAHDIIHRDIKPQNILLDTHGHAKVADFGIATGPDWTRVTRVGAVVGSSRYMSPEQVQGRPVDHRTDIYSLGVVLYEMLAGAPPFDGTTIADIGRQHVRTPPTPLVERRPGIPPELDRVVLHALEKLPENRFQSMDEFLGALVGLSQYELASSTTGFLGTLRQAGAALVDPLVDTGGDLDAPALGAVDSDFGASVVFSAGVIPGLALPSEVGAAEAPTPATTRGTAEARAVDSAQAPSFEPPSYEPLPTAADLAPATESDAGTSRRSFVRRAGIALALLAAVLFAVGLVLWFRSGAGTPLAPDLRGQTVEGARLLSDKAGLTLDTGEDVLATDKPPGTVVSQRPAPGEKVEDGRVSISVSRAPEAVGIASIKDVDPEGDGEERPDLLARIHDGDVATAWGTELYRSATFGNIKKGVGVRFSLTDPAVVVEVISGSKGWKGELRARASDGTSKTVAQLDGSDKQIIVLKEPMRNGQLWITALGSAEKANRFDARIAELRFFR